MGTILKNGVNYSGSSGGGGVSSYNELTGKPQIEGVTLSGNKMASDLGLVKASDIPSTDSFYSTSDTAFTDLADADYMPMYDSSASTKKKTLWSNIKSVLKTYFDSLYQKTLTAGTNISFSGTGNTTINASMPVMGTFSKGDLYDTSEKIIGKWTDGRPLYQRTYSGTIPSSDGTQSLFSLPSSYCRVMYAEGCAFWDGTNYISIPFSTESGSKADHAGLYTYNNTMYIDMTDTNSYFRGKSYYVTIRYIKTSDSTNSYNYASENEYSTSEKIIGTWVDGKTLYQRSYTGNAPTTANTSVNLFSFSSSYHLRDLQGVIYTDSGGVCIPINYTAPPVDTYSTPTAYGMTFLQAGYIGMRVGSLVASASCQYVITLKYTK